MKCDYLFEEVHAVEVRDSMGAYGIMTVGQGGGSAGE